MHRSGQGVAVQVTRRRIYGAAAVGRAEYAQRIARARTLASWGCTTSGTTGVGTDTAFLASHFHISHALMYG